MRKYRVFVDNSLIDFDKRVVHIDKDLQRYVEQVLRGAEDCKIVVFDGSGKEYTTMYDSEHKCLVIEDVVDNCIDKGFSISLFQAVPKGMAMDDIIALCSQLGVDYIYPLITARTTAKQVGNNKLLRWQRIALESGKVGGFCNTTEVRPPLLLRDALPLLSQADLVLFLYENARVNLKNFVTHIETASHIALVVGPEGGFEPSEAEELGKYSVTVSLGPVIFRSRWAASVAVMTIDFIKGLVG